MRGDLRKRLARLELATGPTRPPPLIKVLVKTKEEARTAMAIQGPFRIPDGYKLPDYMSYAEFLAFVKRVQEARYEPKERLRKRGKFVKAPVNGNGKAGAPQA
ncbi:MAG: hypothetical protein HYS13_07570 [Planctomycetia bacterium]|nr:hypothetical protein [Planctomycetia bacterium]